MYGKVKGQQGSFVTNHILIIIIIIIIHWFVYIKLSCTLNAETLKGLPNYNNLLTDYAYYPVEYLSLDWAISASPNMRKQMDWVTGC